MPHPPEPAGDDADEPAPRRLTPAQRSQRARLAALARWAREDPGPTARRGQEGLRNRLATDLDLPPDLDPAERARRVDAAVREHMTRLALASSRARRRGR